MIRKILTIVLVIVSNVSVASGAACPGAAADVIFLLDGSGSVGDSNFRVLQAFAKNVTLALDIRPEVVRVGVIRFSTTARMQFSLGDYTNGTDVRNAIDGIAYTRGGTYTNLGLELLRTEGFSPDNGGRNGTVPRLAVVVTDGNSTVPASTSTEAALVHEAGIKVIAVGIGPTNDAELQAIASTPATDFVFHVDEFSGLPGVEDGITARACQAAEPPACTSLLCRLLSGGHAPRSGAARHDSPASPIGFILLIWILSSGPDNQ